MDRKKLFVARWIPPLALFAVNKILERPRIEAAAERLDRRVKRRQKRAAATVRNATQNARNSPVWLAAGAASILAGIALIAKATRRK